MNFVDAATYTEEQLVIDNLLPDIGKKTVVESIYKGLTSTPKYISSKFFYDAAGSKFFEEITRLPEYYLTRTEKKLLRQLANEQGKDLKDVDIVELGSGDCSKISIILDAVPTYQLDSIRYIPVDFSQPAMEESAMLLMDKYPGINIYGMVADFTSQLELIPDNEKRFICFLGSTLGNLNKTETQRFLTNIRLSMQPDDTFILGIDMVKSKEILEKAYNDNQRITEKFNRNILNVVNDLTSTNFKPGEFEHAAFFNEKESRIEMHLKAMNDMKISSALFPDTIKIKKGEMIHTENSQKYSSEMLRDLLFTTGFKIDRTYTDANKWFSLLQLSTK